MTKIEQVPGVVVAQRAYFMASYQQLTRTVAALATDPNRWFALRPAFKISKTQLATLVNSRTGICSQTV
jgi:hypothetical protein